MPVLNTHFQPIDLEHWDRRQYFFYFTTMLPTGYSLTIEVDITKTYQTIKEQGKQFFPAYLYVASKLIAEQKEFRVASVDGQLGYYEVLHPSYAVFHKDDNSMSNLWTPYCESFSDFYHSYLQDQRHYADHHGILAKPEPPPQNSCMIGMLPWISFTHYSPIPYASTDYYFPVLQAGKYFERDGKKIMPLSIMVHHAVADGYHVALFLEKFQTAMSNPHLWMHES